MLDPRIILAGQAPDIMGEYGRGLETAQLQTDMRRKNALADLYAQQGPQIMAGNPQALNALAAYDPAIAMGIQGTQLDQQATRQGMAYDTERMAADRAQWARDAEQWAADKSQAEIAAQSAEVEAFMRGLVPDISGMMAGDPAATARVGKIAAQHGMDVPTLMQKLVGMDTVLETLKTWQGMQPKPVEAPKPMSTPGKINADVAAGFLTADQAAEAMKPQPGVSVNVGGGSDKQVFDAMNESAAAARQAVTGLAALKEAQTALDNGVITGSFADERLGAAKLGALLGITDPAVIQNTETFRAAIAPQVAAIMKATVGSTQISNADREFAERAAGGSITLDKGTIERLLGIMEKAAKVAIDTHLAKLDAVYPPGSGVDRERAMFGYGIEYAPDKGAPVVIDGFTIEEVQ